jgi:hypothetical protein
LKDQSQQQKLDVIQLKQLVMFQKQPVKHLLLRVKVQLLHVKQQLQRVHLVLQHVHLVLQLVDYQQLKQQPVQVYQVQQQVNHQQQLESSGVHTVDKKNK